MGEKKERGKGHLFIQSFQFEGYGSDAVRTPGYLSSLLDPTFVEVASECQDKHVLVDVSPGPPAEALGPCIVHPHDELLPLLELGTDGVLLSSAGTDRDDTVEDHGGVDTLQNGYLNFGAAN